MRHALFVMVTVAILAGCDGILGDLKDGTGDGGVTAEANVPPLDAGGAEGGRRDGGRDARVDVVRHEPDALTAGDVVTREEASIDGPKRDGSGPGDAPIGTGEGGDGAQIDAAPVACGPHALVGGFTPGPAPPPSIPPCTSMQVQGAQQCFLNPADGSACSAITNGPDAGFNTCGQCIFSPEMTGNDENSSWGATLSFNVLVAAGSSETLALGIFNFGGCIAREDISAQGTSCANAYEAAEACEFAACLASCPVAGANDSAGLTALHTCMQDADGSICETYAMARDSECAVEISDAASSTWSKCIALVHNAEMATLSDPTDLGTFFNLICGVDG